MKGHVPKLVLYSCLLGIQIGCASHNVKFVPSIKQVISPTSHAVPLSGSIDESSLLFEKARLPHNTPRQKYELMYMGLTKLTAQLGSSDYVIIGEVYGGGNARANQTTLTNALCKKAATKGGDVVLIFKRDTLVQPYAYTTPGYSTTTATATANDYGNYATAHGTSQTTYTPSQTYSGVIYKPTANGLVFKHVPGMDAVRKRLLSADDRSLAIAMTEIGQIGNNPDLTWDQAQARWEEVINGAIKSASNHEDSANSATR